jgi:hypothetical protein
LTNVLWRSQIEAVWRSAWAVTCVAMSARVAARWMMSASGVS